MATPLIPNVNLDFSGLGGAVINYLMIASVFLIIAGALGWFVWDKKQKKIFVTPVKLLKLRPDFTFKAVYGLKGGVVMNNVGVRDFKVKIPGVWKKFSLGYMPDFSMAQANDEICFVQLGDGTLWQQCKEKLVAYQDVTEEVISVDAEGKEVTRENVTTRYELLIEPIPTDVKTTTINNIHGIRNLLDKSKMSVYAIGIGAFIIMAIVQIAFLYFTTKHL